MRTRVFICAFVFLLLTAIKINYPATAQKVRDFILPEMSGTGLRSEVIALGRQITGGGGLLFYASKEESKNIPVDNAKKAPDISSDFDLDKMVSDNLVGFVFSDLVGSGSSDKSAENELSGTWVSPDPTEAAQNSTADAVPTEEDEKQQKLEAFLETQAEFTDYDVPAGACFDIPKIPFDSVCPSDGAISSAFGYRVHPVYEDVRFHYGIDYALFDGDPVTAFADGTVVSAEEISGYGQTIVISHGEGFTTLYAHLSKFMVSPGDKVTLGQTIALGGHSGNATGPHLHFEVECDGVRYNPELCY